MSEITREQCDGIVENATYQILSWLKEDGVDLDDFQDISDQLCADSIDYIHLELAIVQQLRVVLAIEREVVRELDRDRSLRLVRSLLEGGIPANQMRNVDRGRPYLGLGDHVIGTGTGLDENIAEGHWENTKARTIGRLKEVVWKEALWMMEFTASAKK